MKSRTDMRKTTEGRLCELSPAARGNHGVGSLNLSVSGVNEPFEKGVPFRLVAILFREKCARVSPST